MFNYSVINVKSRVRNCHIYDFRVLTDPQINCEFNKLSLRLKKTLDNEAFK